MKKEFKSFEDAREFVVSLHLRNNKEWRLLIKSNKKPYDIPSNPDSVYKNKGWISWGDWLGTGTIGPRLRKHRSFTDARMFVHSLELRNQHDWSQFCKSDKKPKDIPQSPITVYKKEFKGFGDWLGTGIVANRKRKFSTFTDAKIFVHKLNLESKNDWDKFSKSNKLPKNIPTNPNRSYKKEWIDWGDWLGTGRIATHLKQYRSFQEARNYVQVLGLKNPKGWKAFVKTDKMPQDIPRNPNQVYKDKGWNGFHDWLGIYRIGSGLKKHILFEDARKFARALGLTGANEWKKFAKSDKMPQDIPRNPNQVYKDKGWTSWGDWTGTNVIATYKIKYRTHSEAKKFVRSLGLKTANEWRAFVKSGKLPKDIPANPWTTYSKKRKKK